MAAHTDIRAALATLLLVTVLAVSPGIATPAQASPTAEETQSAADPEEDEGRMEEDMEYPPVGERPSEQPADSEPEPSPDELSMPSEPAEREEAEAGDVDDAPDTDEAAEEDAAPEEMMQRNTTMARGSTATVEVKVGAERGGSGVKSLAGARLGLFTSLRASNPVNGLVCTSQADGVCRFNNVPAQTGNLFVKALAEQPNLPSHTAVSHMGTGSWGQAGPAPYGFRVGERVQRCFLSLGNTCLLPSSSWDWTVKGGKTYEPLTEAASDSTGVFTFVRSNPPLPTQCGQEIAVISDISSSSSLTGSDLSQASTTLLGHLNSTPSNVTLFGTGSGRDGGIAAGNWDRQLNAALSSGAEYDAAIFISDTNPTSFGANQGDRRNTRFAEVENAVLSANALKAKGTHVIAVGVGVSGNGTRLNLESVSSPGAAIQTLSYKEAAGKLVALLEQDCGGSVSVVKNVIPVNGESSQAAPTADWPLTAESSSPAMRRTDGSTGKRLTGTTDASGTFTVGLDFSRLSRGATTDVSLRETARDGFVLEQVDGQNARCTDESGQIVPATNDDGGFTLTGVGPGQDVHCVLVSRELPPEASVAVDNTWVINGAEYPHGSQPEGIDATLEVSESGDAEAPLREATWGEENDGYFAGDQIRLEADMNIRADRAGCELVSTSVDGDASGQPGMLSQEGFRSGPLDAGLTRVAVIHTVECDQRLTLTSDVVGGTASPQDWTQSVYTTPGDPSAGEKLPASEESSRTFSVQEGNPYQLAATGGPAVYAQDDSREDASLSPLATGSWRCVQVDGGGTPLDASTAAGGAEGTVEVPLGGSIDCTATHRTAELTLLKLVINGDGGTLVPEDFELAAATEFNGSTLSSGPVVGREQRNEATTVLVRPNSPYTVTEQSVRENLAFHQGELQRYTGDPDQDIDHESDQLWETVADTEISVSAETPEIYRLIGYDVAPSILPQTGGLGTLPYLLGGAAFIVLAALAALRFRGASPPLRRRDS